MKADTIIRCDCGNDTFSRMLGSNDWIKCDECGHEHLNTEDAQFEYWDKTLKIKRVT